MARHTRVPAPVRDRKWRRVMRKRQLLLLPHLQYLRLLQLGPMGRGHRALCQLSPRLLPHRSNRKTTKRSPARQQSGGSPDVVVRVHKAAKRSHAHRQAGIGSAGATQERKARRKQHKQAGSTSTAAEPEPAAQQTSRKRQPEPLEAASAGKQHKKRKLQRQLVVQEHQHPADTPPQDSEQEQMQQEQHHHQKQQQEQPSQQPHTQQPEQLDQLDPLLREQLQLLGDLCMQQQQQQQEGSSRGGTQCPQQQQQQQRTRWLVRKLQRFRAQLERQQRPLTQAEWGRVAQVAAAVAADLDATDRASLLAQLGHVAEVAQAVPRHCVGELDFCTECRQDLEGALLVYFLVKEDGAAEHKLCRSCFLAAVWEWLQQQLKQAKAEFQEAVCCCNLLEGDCTCPPHSHSTMFDMTHLNDQQQRQLTAWIDAAFAQQGSSWPAASRDDCPASSSSSSSGGGKEGSGADDSTGGCPRPFVLPSPRHARLLVARPLLEGGAAWPVEYCSLQGGLTALRRLTEVVQALPDFQVPPYSHLGQVRPCIVEEPMVLDRRGTATLTVDGLRELLGLMQPRQLAEALKPTTGRLSADRVVEDMLIAVGLLPKRKPGRQARAAAAAAAAAAGGGGDGSSSGAQQQQQQLQPQVSEGLYFNFNPIDQQHPQGVVQDNRLAAPSVAAADAAVNHHLHGLADSVRPTAYQAESWQVVKHHIKRLEAVAAECRVQQRQSQADTDSAARASLRGRSAAYRFLAAVLKARFNEATGEVAAHDLLTQALLLLGGEGTGTRGHLDPAAAVTYAIGLVPPGQKQWDPATPLVSWLFISPDVFADTALLRRLLWVLQHLKHQRAAVGAAQQLAAMQGKRGRLIAARRAAQQAVVAEAEAFSQRWQQQKQQWEEQPQRQQQQGGCGDSDSEQLTAEEQEWLTSLLLYSRLDPGEMAAVQAELGGQYTAMLVQRAGEGVWVPVGWMHWVHNSRPCIKCAWEVVRPQALAGCVLMHRRLRCRAHGLPHDYLGLVQGAVRELAAWRHFL